MIHWLIRRAIENLYFYFFDELLELFLVVAFLYE
jgi:hypothetical protein